MNKDYNNIELIHDSINLYGRKINRRGIRFNFINGYGISIMFGEKSKSINFNKKIKDINQSDDCEVTILYNGKISSAGIKFLNWNNSTKNNVSTDELCSLMNTIKSLKGVYI